MSLIYPPEGDSYLLEQVLEKEIPKLRKENVNLKFLEIGIGSGIQLETLEKLGAKKENIFGIDLNIEAVEHCKKLGFNVWKSNLFSEIKGKYDVILFNPPYLPKSEGEDEESELITTGGKNGSEIINKFLIQAKKHLEKNGRIYLLISSLTKGVNWLDYEKKLVTEKKLFFEKLEVLELSF